MAICENCCLLIPSRSSTAAVTSFIFVITLPSGKLSCASASCFVNPSPLFEGRMYSGLRLMKYPFPACSNVSSTYVGVSSSAYLDLNIQASLFSPLASPYNAKHIASNMVVLPAPVSPVIRYSPLVPSLSIGISVYPAYGPNADILRSVGRIILLPRPNLCIPIPDFSGHRS